MQTRLVRAALTGVCLTWLGVAHAQPLQWSTAVGGNGHYYERIDLPLVTWDEAKADAESRSFQGRDGYLVTITSQSESDFVVVA